jgi:hypothetical protein
MARTVFHGGGRQQHHNVNAAILQPFGDPDGLRRHAIPVKVSRDFDFIRLLYNVVCFAFSTRLFQLFSYLADKDFFLCIFSLVVAYSMIPTFAREHRTFFWEGKARISWLVWDWRWDVFNGENNIDSEIGQDGRVWVLKG